MAFQIHGVLCSLSFLVHIVLGIWILIDKNAERHKWNMIIYHLAELGFAQIISVLFFLERPNFTLTFVRVDASACGVHHILAYLSIVLTSLGREVSLWIEIFSVVTITIATLLSACKLGAYLLGHRLPLLGELAMVFLANHGPKHRGAAVGGQQRGRRGTTMETRRANRHDIETGGNADARGVPQEMLNAVELAEQNGIADNDGVRLPEDVQPNEEQEPNRNAELAQREHTEAVNPLLARAAAVPGGYMTYGVLIVLFAIVGFFFG